MKSRNLIVALIAACLALLLFAKQHATAAQPHYQGPEIVRARVSVPPTGPIALESNTGFASVSSPYTGVYHVELEPGRSFTAYSVPTCSGTEAGVTCAIEVLDASTLIVHRDWLGSPDDGDVTLIAIL